MRKCHSSHVPSGPLPSTSSCFLIRSPHRVAPACALRASQTGHLEMRDFVPGSWEELGTKRMACCLAKLRVPHCLCVIPSGPHGPLPTLTMSFQKSRLLIRLDPTLHPNKETVPGTPAKAIHETNHCFCNTASGLHCGRKRNEYVASF